ncbi:MAG: tRNA (guanosine(37)-N1)-methyltransferase TrmD [Acetatifactor sp.]
MKFHVLTLFPEMIMQGLAPSIIGRAVEKNIISLDAVNIRNYTQDKHGKVDDYTYGGGAGMLMQAQPVYDAHRAVAGNRSVRTIYLTPQGRPFTQKLAREFSKEEELIFLCGHYEGVDERVLEEVVTDYVSVGDYVLTGGELPAMVMIDAIARLVPGVLGNETSADEESFYNDLLEYPQYSRPEVWHGKKVPEVLLSGNHSKVNEWRLKQSEERTKKMRPDLYARYEEKQRLIKSLSKDKRNNIPMIESLRRGFGEILYAEGANVLIYDREEKICMILAENQTAGEKLTELVPEDTDLFLVSQEFMKDVLLKRDREMLMACHQYLYTQKETLPVRYKEIHRLSMEQLAYVCNHYEHDDSSYLEERIHAGFLYGAFDGERIVGFAGMHGEGSMGLLYVDEAYRRRGIAESLEAYVVNRMLERGWTPYGHVIEGNEVSGHLQEKLGLYKAGRKVWWLKQKKQ